MSAALAVMATMAVVGTAYSVYSGEKQAGSQKKAYNASQAQAQAQFEQSQQAIRRQDRKTPNVRGLLDEASMADKGGPASTLLTGPGGIDTKNLAINKPSLLGG